MTRKLATFAICALFSGLATWLLLPATDYRGDDAGSGATSRSRAPLPVTAESIARQREQAGERQALLLRLSELDSGAVIAALADIENRSLRRQLALELIRSTGLPIATIENLAVVAGEGNQGGFVSDALVAAAASDPVGAMRMALDIGDPAIRETTVHRVASEWAQQHPYAALGFMIEIPEARLRHEFFRGLAFGWISVDPGAALSFMTSGEGQQLLSRYPQTHLASLLSMLVSEIPLDILQEASFDMSESLGQQLRYRIMTYSVDTDLPGALARLETLSDGDARSMLLGAIADAYAWQDPERAIRWAREVDQPPSAGTRLPVLASVLNAIALFDPERAYEVLLSEAEFTGSTTFMLSADMAPWHTSDDVRSILDTLVVAKPSRTQRAALENVVRAWTPYDPEGMWDWLSAQDLESNSSLVRVAAESLVVSNYRIPPQFVDVLPEAARGQLITTYGTYLAINEPDAAVAWLQSHGGYPGYDDWAESIARSLALPGRREHLTPLDPLYPIPAARMVDTMSLPPPPDVAASISDHWARQQPREAIEWAMDRRDSASQAAGVAAAIGAWTLDDPAAARQWTLALPRGELRDSALTAQLTQEIATHGSIDQRILDAFSSDDALSGAMNRRVFAYAFAALGSREPEQASRLIDAHIDDPDIRRSILEYMDQLRQDGRRVSRETVLSVLAP